MATFTPRPVLGQRMELARDLMRRASVGPRSTAALSPIANALFGLSGGLNRIAADRGAQQNQQIRQQLFEQASGGNADLARLLMQSGDPQLQNAGINVAAQQQRTVQPTALQRNLEAAGIKPGTPAFRDAVLRGTQRGTEVNIINKGQQKGSEALFKNTADQFQKSQEDAAIANERQGSLLILEDALSNPDVFTGTGGDAINKIKQAGSTLLGLDFRGVPDAELARTIGTGLALKLRTELPGKLSDTDVKLLKSLPPGLNRSPEANRRLLEILRLQNDLKIRKAEIWRNNLDPERGVVSPEGFADIAQADAQAARAIKSKIQDLRAQSKQLSSRSPLAGVPIGQMTESQLNSLDPNDLTLNQKREAGNRLRTLQGR